MRIKIVLPPLPTNCPLHPARRSLLVWLDGRLVKGCEDCVLAFRAASLPAVRT